VVALVAFFVFLMLQAMGESLPLRGRIERFALLGTGFSLAIVGANAHFVCALGLSSLWSSQVTYVLNHMAQGSAWPNLGLAEAVSWRRLPWLLPYLVVYVMLPAVYTLVICHCWRTRQDSESKHWNELALLALVGAALFAEVLVGLSWLRVFAISLPGFVLLHGVSRKRRGSDGSSWSLRG
jgi:hypothetical protein